MEYFVTESARFDLFAAHSISRFVAVIAHFRVFLVRSLRLRLPGFCYLPEHFSMPTFK